MKKNKVVSVCVPRRLMAIVLCLVLVTGNMSVTAYAQQETGAEVIEAEAESVVDAEVPDGQAPVVTEADVRGDAAEDISGTAEEIVQEAAAAEEISGEETLVGEGTELSLSLDSDGYYKVETLADWESLANYVENGGETAGKNFRLTMHFVTEVMIGTEENPFRGKFDGNCKVVIFDPKNDGGTAVGLFRYAEGAVFEGFHLLSSIPSGAASTGALVGEARGNVRILGCDTIYSYSGDGSSQGGSYGSFVGTGAAGSCIEIERSVVFGSLTGISPDAFGGFIGRTDGEVNIKDSLFAPETLEVNAPCMAVFFNGGSGGTLEDAYYAAECGSVNEGARRAVYVTAGENVKITPDYGTLNTTYYSWYNSYQRGISYREHNSNPNTYVAKSGMELPLGIEYTGDGNLYGYTAGAGELTESNGKYVLTVPEEDVVITAEEGVSLTIDNGGHGTVTADEAAFSEDGYILPGTDVELAVTADTGYALDTLKYDETEIVPDEGVYRFVMPARNVTVTAAWKKYHAVTLGEGTEDAGITLNGDSFAKGEEVVVSVGEQEGRVLDKLLYNGNEIIGQDGTFRFTMPDEDVAITATWHLFHSVLLGEGTEYVDISLNGNSFPVGETVTGTVAAHAGYVLDKLQYNGIEIVPRDGIFSFTMPDEDVTVDAVCKKGHRILIDETITEAEITASSDSAVEGETVTLTVTPKEYYILDFLRMNDVDLTVEDGAASFVMPDRDAVITAGFIMGGHFWGRFCLDPY